VCAFTRHPTALATALGHLHGLGLSANELRVAETIAMRADREGLYWGRVHGEVEALTGLSPNTIRVIGRALRRRGLVDWVWVKPFGRYPRRETYDKPVIWGQGKRTAHGGRVWVFRWEKCGVGFRSRSVGMESGGLIAGDQSGLIASDQSSDPSRSPSELVRVDPAPALRSVAAPAAPARMTAPVPRATRDPMRLELRIGAPDAAIARPAAANAESETPRADEASRASPHGPDVKREIERLGGVRGDGAGERGTPRRPVSDEQLEAFRRQMAGVGLDIGYPGPPDRG
jgi:hypothetical protein